MLKRLIIIAVLVMALVLAGCGVIPGLSGEPTEIPLTETPTQAPTSTPPQLAPTLGGFNTMQPPTLTASPEGQGGPTALPPPTQIGAASATPTPTQIGAAGATTTGTPATQSADSSAAQPTPTQLPTRAPSGPGISIDPQLGEPGDVVIVDGSGFAPNEEVTFHWWAGDGSAALLPNNYSMDADANGNLTIGLKVPTAEKWQGGSAEENELIQLRATAESLEFNYFWASFKYIKRIGGSNGLALTFENPDYSYAISTPNGWTWTWTEDQTEWVRFASPTGSGRGFVRVYNTTNVQSAINQVMTAEGLTAASSKQATLGNFPGTEVTTTNGRTIWFIQARTYVYALSFTDDNGNFYTAIASSLQIK